MKVKCSMPISLWKRVSKVAKKRKISFNEAAVFLIEEVNAPCCAQKGAFTRKGK